MYWIDNEKHVFIFFSIIWMSYSVWIPMESLKFHRFCFPWVSVPKIPGATSTGLGRLGSWAAWIWGYTCKMHIYIWTYIYIYICKYIHIYITYVYIQLYIYIDIYIYKYIYTYIYIYIVVYLYICIHINLVFWDINVYIYINRNPKEDRKVNKFNQNEAPFEWDFDVYPLVNKHGNRGVRLGGSTRNYGSSIAMFTSLWTYIYIYTYIYISIV